MTMVRREPQAEPQPANLSIGQIQLALPKLKRRLEEVKGFNAEEAAKRQESSAGKDVLLKVEETLMEIFGHTSIEYNRYKIPSFYHSRVISLNSRGGPSHSELLENYTKGKRDAIVKLETAISTLEEKLSDASISAGGLTPLTLEGCDFHQATKAACGRLYRDQHYAEAVEAACKALNAQVQIKSGKFDINDTALMDCVFSVGNPILSFNDLVDKHDQGEQQGMMYLYKGVFMAYRNQRAHKLIQDDQQTAFGVINMIDFLIKMLDKAIVNS